MELTNQATTVPVLGDKLTPQAVEQNPAWREFKSKWDLQGNLHVGEKGGVNFTGNWAYPGRWSDYSADGVILDLPEDELESMDSDDVGYQVFEKMMDDALKELKEKIPGIKQVRYWVQEERIELFFE